ncbi:MAG TPA: DUF1360 domain-containing protein [Iamia sp.]
MSRRARPPALIPIDPVELAVDVLATYRLTRLATADVISEPWRQAVLRRVGLSSSEGPATPAAALVEAEDDPPRLATVVTCRWCAGIWIAAGVGLARSVAPQAWSPVARALALSAGAVLLARLEDDQG